MGYIRNDLSKQDITYDIEVSLFDLIKLTSL
jgi:hypothetical protein